jgi:hypothetical protein
VARPWRTTLILYKPLGLRLCCSKDRQPEALGVEISVAETGTFVGVKG